MARTFVFSSSQYAEYAGAVVSAHPLSMAAWVRPTSINSSAVVSIRKASANQTGWAVYATPGTGVQFQTSIAGGGSGLATSSATVSSGVWSHVAGVTPDAANRFSFLNGANKGSNFTNTGNPTLIDRTTIGGEARSSGHDSYADWDIGEVAIWNVALTDLDVAVLALGVSPLLVRPEGLVGYWIINGQDSPEIDLIGHHDMTLGGTPAAAAHPRIIRPASFRQGLPSLPQSKGRMFLAF